MGAHAGPGLLEANRHWLAPPFAKPDGTWDFVFQSWILIVDSSHCGWCTQLRDGRFVPTFPNARYVYVRREYERWDPRRPDHKPVDYNAGVEIEPAYGHTLGHSILHLGSQGEEAYFTGDVFHHPLQMLHPELHMPGCDDLEQAIGTRRRVAGLCSGRS